MTTKLNILPELSEAQLGRFFDKVDKFHPSGCHIWTGSAAFNRYGSVTLNGKSYRAHRIAFWIHTGEQPKDLFVCHKCDNPTCVNPEHLFLGTSSDNMQDMIAKGRANRASGERHGLKKYPERVARGEQMPAAKLTEEKVREIRQLYVEGNPVQLDVAAQYGLTHRSIGMLLHGQTWTHVPISESDAAAIRQNLSSRNRGWGARSARSKHPESTARGSSHGNAKINEDQVREIRKAHAEGESQSQISKKFNINQTTVGRIITRKQWAHVQP